MLVSIDMQQDSSDTYLTIEEESEAVYRDRSSKFIAHIKPVSSESSFIRQLTKLRALHPKANHICYAYRIGFPDCIQRTYDDGEPSGSAGRPILNELLSSELYNIGALVIRYFGGTKLGIPGLINAYKQSTRLAIVNSRIIETFEVQKVKLLCPLDKTGIVYDLLKRHGIDQITSSFDKQTVMNFFIRKSQCQQTLRSILASYENIDEEAIDPQATYDVKFRFN